MKKGILCKKKIMIKMKTKFYITPCKAFEGHIVKIASMISDKSLKTHGHSV